VKRIAVIVCVVIAVSHVAFGDVWYVDCNATGDETGVSWENAFTSIQAGINAAGSDDEVWVAECTYEESVSLKSDVWVYGDFAGTEDPDVFDPETDRTIGTHPTIIDASTADGGGPDDHVVVMYDVSNVRIDGFTITGAVADGLGDDKYGGGIYYYYDYVDSTNMIANCTIIGNSASKGGGIYCFLSYVTVSNCTISGNSADEGGGVYISRYRPHFTKCTISGNSASSTGGGMHGYRADPRLTNCMISGNEAPSGGGGYFEGVGSTRTLTVTNCTIVGNSADGGGGIRMDDVIPFFANTIFVDNTNYAVREDILTSESGAVIYCLFYDNPNGDYFDEGLTPYTGAGPINTGIDGASDNVDDDPMFKMGAGGTWTDVPTHDVGTNRTTLTDSAAAFVPDDTLAGMLLNADTSQWFQALITANTETTIEVVGDVTGFADNGDTYEVIDYHLQFLSEETLSGAIDYGADLDATGSPAPADDFEGDLRGFDGDILGAGGTGDGSEYDIGVDEFRDDESPKAVCQDITRYLGDDVTITPGDIDGGSTDNVAIKSLTFDDGTVEKTFYCTDLGDHLETLRVEDYFGHIDTCLATVTVEDNENPIALCKDPIVELDGEGSVTITPDDVDDGSTDNCGISSMTVEPDTFTGVDIGENTVTLTVTDDSDNTDTCEATVTVNANEPPAAVCCDITVELDETCTVTITPEDIDCGSTDNCGISSLAIEPDTFTGADIGDNTVTLTVTDAVGNTADCQAMVTVEDNISPTAVCQDITVELDATGTVTITGEDVDGGSSDNCAISSLDVVPGTFTCADRGDNIVTLTVTDTAGNTADCQATVTVSMPGDVDRDGEVDAIDVQLVINAALGLDVAWDCDIDHSGSVDAVDAVDVQLVINATLGINICGTL